MTRLPLLLAVLCVFSALGVVASHDKARKLYTELDREKEHMAQLGTEFDQLQLEQRTWAAHARVEQIARNKLQMLTPAPGTVLALTPRDGSGRP